MRKELGMFCALVAMCVMIAISNSDALSHLNILNTSRQVELLGIYAIGVGFVIITGGIDLSIGSVIGLTGVIIAKLSAPLGEGAESGLGLSLWIGIPVALGVALLIGLAQGLLITRLNLQPFIVTLGGMLMLKGVSQVLTTGGSISLGSITINHLPFRDIGDKNCDLGHLLHLGSFSVPYTVLMFLGVALVATYVLHFTVFGRHLYAIGGNRDAALYSGVPVKRVEATTYVISSFLAGVAGVAYAAYIGQMSHTVGEGYELYAITAAVIGGCSLRGGEGTVLGIVIGAAIIRVLDNGINMFKIGYTDAQGHAAQWGLSDNWRNVIIGAVILAAVILDQVSHLLRNRKRTKGAVVAVAAK